MTRAPSLETFHPALFAGKSVAITGGGTGIGLQTALHFASLGARVSICGRRSDVLSAARAQINAASTAAGFAANAHVHAVDVKKPDEIAAWRDAFLAEASELDYLVCNAGANFLAPAAGITPNGFATVIGTVLLGTWNTIHAWYPHFAARPVDVDRAIVMMAATNGIVASPLMAHSGAGKAGMLNLTQTLAVEWAPLGIRVNAVAPGPVDTEGANARLWSDAAARAKVVSTVPLGRMGTAEDCAGAVLLLCAPVARFMTGTTVTIDGGSFLKPVQSWFG